MPTFYVDRYNRSFSDAAQTTLTHVVQRYSGMAVGGFDQAEINIEGDVGQLLSEVHRWLGYYYIIRNENMTPVWAGKVTQTTTFKGKRKKTLSLDEMQNRIAVAYSYDDPSGTSTRGTTNWADDTESQARYGVKEQLQSQGDLDSTHADSLRDKALSDLSDPTTIITFDGGGDKSGGTLYLRGLWSTTAWRIFNQSGGVVKFDDSGNYEHLLGWGLSSNLIGFEATQDGLHDLGDHAPTPPVGHLDALRKDDVIVVSGAANGGNNGTFTVKQAVSNDVSRIGPTTTISFEVTDDIKSSTSVLGPIQATQLLLVSGSAVGGNNRYYFTNTDLAADHITVLPATVANSAAGSAVTLKQGHSVLLNASLTTEYPSNTITVTALGTIVAQSFTLSVNSPFTAAEVFLRLKRVGSPSDSVQVFIESDSAGSPSNISLESVSVLGSTISDEMNWVKFTFANTLALTYGTTYWLVVWRTGSNSTTDYYMLDLAEDANGATTATYTGGIVKLWNGSAWITRTNNADMPFQIWAHKETTAQISDMLTTAGQFLVGQDFQIVSGLSSRQFRDADQAAQTEIETLLKAGVSGGRRMLADVTPDRVVHIYQEPTYNVDSAPMLDEDNNLLSPLNSPYETGQLPFGKWITLMDELPDEAGVFIERAEYDATSGEYTLTPKGAPDPWDIVTLI